jgi:hypothetical protein
VRSGLGAVDLRIWRRRTHRLLWGRGPGSLLFRCRSSSPAHVHPHSMHIYTYAKSSHSLLGIAPAAPTWPSANRQTPSSLGSYRRSWGESVAAMVAGTAVEDQVYTPIRRHYESLAHMTRYFY